MLTVTDSVGNQIQFQIQVAVNYFSTAVINASCDTCANGSVTLTFPAPHPYSLLTVSPTQGTWNGTTLSGLIPGDYFICSEINSCTYCDSVHILSPDAITEIEQENFIHVFTNPASITINVNVEGHNTSNICWNLRSIDGRALKNNSEGQPQFVIPIESIAKGIYFLEITTNSSRTLKIIKE